jgi:hypothetical protein
MQTWPQVIQRASANLEKKEDSAKKREQKRGSGASEVNRNADVQYSESELRVLGGSERAVSVGAYDCDESSDSEGSRVRGARELDASDSDVYIIDDDECDDDSKSSVERRNRNSDGGQASTSSPQHQGGNVHACSESELQELACGDDIGMPESFFQEPDVKREMRAMIQTDLEEGEEDDFDAEYQDGNDDDDDDDVLDGVHWAEVYEPVRLKRTCLPSSVPYTYTTTDEHGHTVYMPIPECMPHPTSAGYQDFLSAFFTGKVQGAESHDWTQELNHSLNPRGAEHQSQEHVLSVWQAVGYMHARKVLDCRDMHGSLFWWTPGSGKSIMVALLIDLLYDTDRPVYVVSTPQNTRQNGLKECVRALLKFSPRFNIGARTPTENDEKMLLTLFRKRKPPIRVRDFLSFRQFTTACTRSPPAIDLLRAAVIIDESHELFNPRICNRKDMWGAGVLERLCSNDSDSKVFTLSGTPGRNWREFLLQMELVRFSHERIDMSSLQGAGNWRERFGEYAKGRVSYVDGAVDRSRFPVKKPHEKIVCEITKHQIANFGERAHRMLTNLKFTDFKEMAMATSDEKTRRNAVNSLGALQIAATCYWGGSINGLNSCPKPDLETVRQYAPKYASIIAHVVGISRKHRLQKKHFIYSGRQNSITQLCSILKTVVLDPADGVQSPEVLGPANDGHSPEMAKCHFKHLEAHDLVWKQQSEGVPSIQLVTPVGEFLDFPEQIVFVCLTGNAYRKEDRDKVMAAFGRVMPDGTRFEGKYTGAYIYTHFYIYIHSYHNYSIGLWYV